MRIDGMPASAIPITPPSHPTPTPKNFSEFLLRATGEVNHSQAYVENLMERVAAGENINPAVVAAAVNKNELAFQTMIQIRNKLVQAFDELRQLQV